MAVAALIIVGASPGQQHADRVACWFSVERSCATRSAAATRRSTRCPATSTPNGCRTSLRSRLSHELRTPLNSIITLSQLMIEDQQATLSPDQRKYIEVIRRNGRNLLALVDHLGEGGAAASARRRRAAAPNRRLQPTTPPDARRRRRAAACPGAARARTGAAHRGRPDRAPAHRQLHRSRGLRRHARRLRRGRARPAAQPAVRGGRARPDHARDDRASTSCAPRAPRTAWPTCASSSCRRCT